LERKGKFEKQFSQTLLNFSINMDFLCQQQVGADSLVGQVHERTDLAIQRVE
jgi:hypothetical protein